MGVSSDGILFYGFPIEEGSEIHDRIMSYEDDESEDMLGYLYQNGETECGVGIGSHCSDSYPMFYLYAQKQIAARGYPIDVDVKIDGEWNKSIREFCKKYKIPWEKPRWCLASYLG